MSEQSEKVDAFDSVEGWLRLEAGYFLGGCFVAMYEPDALEISHGESAVAADDSGRSFLPKHVACMPIAVLRSVLAPHGLDITAARTQSVETTTPETLTEEERATINRYALDGRGQDLLMAKLLRLHDAQAARVKELEERQERVRALAETGKATQGRPLAEAILDVLYEGRERP
jgi:hypothetical protein